MKIGRYDILEVIGQGAMGTVYKALDPLIERTVAIKTVPLVRLKEEGAEFEVRFLREAQSAGRLSHPNIVTIYDVGETDKVAYIAMEYLSGATLRDIMDKGPMPPDLALETAQQIAEALAYAHEHGVIHRDIKPSNVIVTSQRGQVKLTDFGIAHLANSERTHTGLMLGSPRYMSPEQAMGREIDGRSDIFSLGAVLYEMVSGEYAFDGESLPSILYRVINETPTSPTKLRPEISAAFERIIMRMLDKQAQARLDAHVLIEELQKLGQPTPTPVSTAIANRVPRLLAIIAFTIPAAVFLIIGIGIIVINYFMAPPHSLQSRSITPPKPYSAITNQVEEPKQAVAIEPAADIKKQIQVNRLHGRKTARDAYLQGLEKKKVELEIKRTELLLKYTDQHPDVMLINRQLEQLEVERKRYLRGHEGVPY